MKHYLGVPVGSAYYPLVRRSQFAARRVHHAGSMLEISSGVVSSVAECGLAADECGRDADCIREAGAHRGVLAGYMIADGDRQTERVPARGVLR
jgi:hypothetical protein